MDTHLACIDRRSALSLSFGGAVIAALLCKSAWAEGGRASGSPSAPLEVEETRIEVIRVLDELPDRQRVVLEWKYLDSLRVCEIAERLGDSEKAVETVLYRARREFRRLFEAKRPGGVAVQAIHERGIDFPQQSQS